MVIEAVGNHNHALSLGSLSADVELTLRSLPRSHMESPPVPAVAQTVILAAGSGRRLTQGRPDVPKPLLHVAGRPLLAHALGQAVAAGCQEAVVVVKHQASAVEAFLDGLNIDLRIRTVHNPHDGPNGLSLLAAEPLAADRFFLQMADHVFAAPVLARLADPVLAPTSARLLVDRHPRHIDLDDATKVRVAGAEIVAIGKRIAPWNAVDTGCFVLTARVFAALREVPAEEPLTVSSGIRRLAADGLMSGVDLEDVAWMDVDTPADQRDAEQLFTGQTVLPA
jgi:choline kinase